MHWDKDDPDEWAIPDVGDRVEADGHIYTAVKEVIDNTDGGGGYTIKTTEGDTAIIFWIDGVWVIDDIIEWAR